MKPIYILFFLLLFSLNLFSQETAKFDSRIMINDARKIENNYAGIDLILNPATLEETGERALGLGAGLFYQSFIATAFSYKVMFSFLANSYSGPMTNTVNNPLMNSIQELYFNRDANLYNFVIGIVFNYYIYLDKLFTVSGALKDLYPYISTGLLSSKIYATYKYKYLNTDLLPFIETAPQSKWLSTSFTLPLGLGFNYMLDSNNVINLEMNYYFIFFNEVDKTSAYNNLWNFKLGYMRAVNFKL